MESQQGIGDDRAKARHGILLTLAAVMPVMAIVSLIPVLPMMLGEFADVPGSTVLVPVALTLPALCVALLSPFVGLVADRFGRKPILIGALILYAITGMLPIVLDDLVAIIVSRGFLGVAEATIMTTATTLLGDYFKGPRLDRWVAIQIGVVSIAAILLTGIGGLLGDVFGSRGPFYLYVVALPFAAVAAAMLFEPVRAEVRDAAKRRFPIASFLPLLAATFGVGILFYTLFLQIGPLLGIVGVTSPAAIGIAAALANVGNVGGSVLFKLLSNRRAALLLPLGLAVAAAGYAGAALAGSYGTVTGFAMLASLGSGIMLPTLLARTLSRLPIEIRGRGAGLWTGTFFLAQFAAPVAASIIAPAIGGLQHVLLVLAAGAALGCVFAALQRGKASEPLPAH